MIDTWKGDKTIFFQTFKIWFLDQIVLGNQTKLFHSFKIWFFWPNRERQTKHMFLTFQFIVFDWIVKGKPNNILRCLEGQAHPFEVQGNADLSFCSGSRRLLSIQGSEQSGEAIFRMKVRLEKGEGSHNYTMVCHQGTGCTEFRWGLIIFVHLCCHL